jgi:hypothetical protein
MNRSIELLTASIEYLLLMTISQQPHSSGSMVLRNAH